MMLKRLMVLCLIFASGLFPEIEMTKRNEIRLMKTAIIVPCVPLHIELLKELLTAYSCQTVIPDEVIVAFSESTRVDAQAWEWFDTMDWPFVLKIVKTAGHCSPGKNRNIGVENTSCEIILCNDADDLPHPQRVEIVKYLFEHYELEHLLHGWLSSAEMFQINESKKEWKAVYQLYPEEFQLRYHNANVCLLREVWEKIKWRETFEIDLDKIFNQTIYHNQLCEHRGVFFGDLIQWRTDLSTYNRGRTY